MREKGGSEGGSEGRRDGGGEEGREGMLRIHVHMTCTCTFVVFVTSSALERRDEVLQMNSH